MAYVRVKDYPGLVRDTETNSIINVDEAAYKKHQQNKLLKETKFQKERDKEERLNNIESTIKSLENKLSLILEKITNGNSGS